MDLNGKMKYSIKVTKHIEKSVIHIEKGVSDRKACHVK